MIEKLKCLSKYQAYIKSALLYFSSSLFSAITGIILNPVMARNLLPVDYAVLGYFNSFSGIILPLTNFGMITYFMRNYYNIHEDRKEVVTDSIMLALLLFGLIILLLSFSFFYYYGLWSHISFPVFPFVFLAFTPIYLNNFITLYLVKCRLNKESRKYSKLMVYNTILTSSLGILFVVFLKYGAQGRMIATLISTGLISVYCFFQVFKKFQFDIVVIKDAMLFGWPISLSAILWYFLSGVDSSMLEKLKDNHTFGIYNVGMQMAGYFAIFYTAISNTFEPDIYRAISEDQRGKLFRIIFVVLIINAIPNLFFILLAPLIIGVLTYNRYLDAVDFAQILALKNISVTFYYEISTIIIGYGFAKSELVIRFCGAVLCFLLYKKLIANYGFYGAAWGQVFAFIIMSMLGGLFIYFMFQKKKFVIKVNN